MERSEIENLVRVERIYTKSNHPLLKRVQAQLAAEQKRRLDAKLPDLVAEVRAEEAL
jgi:hypothetical protein